MRVNTNVSAVNAQRNLATSGLMLAKSVEKLSSGLRINRAADDAAGLTISEKLRGQVKGLNQGIRNSQDGISMIQTAEGALNESHSILQRMRELTVQAANETLTTSDRDAISQELSQLKTEIDRIATDTEFNTKKLLNGSLKTSLDSTSALQNGEGAGTGVVVQNIDVSNARFSTTFNITTTTSSVTITNATTNVAQTVTVSSMDSNTATQVLDFSNLGIKISLSGTQANASNITAGIATSGATIITATNSGSANFQVGANANQTVSVGVASAHSTAIGGAGGYASVSAAVSAFSGAGLTTTVANNMLLSIDDALADVSGIRATLGSVQNRLEHTVANLSVASENLLASESRIRDADMAEEMVGFTKNQIISQAGTAILAQANQTPQGILSLLR